MHRPSASWLVVLAALGCGAAPTSEPVAPPGPARAPAAPRGAPDTPVVAAPGGLDPTRTELNGVAIAPRAGVAHVVVAEVETHGTGRRVRGFSRGDGRWSEARVPGPAEAIHHAVAAAGAGRIVVTSRLRQGDDVIRLVEPAAETWRAREDVPIGFFDTVAAAGERVVVASLSTDARDDEDERDDSLGLSLREGAATLAEWSVPRTRGRAVLVQTHGAVVALDGARVAVGVVRCPTVGPHSFELVNVRCRLDLFVHPGPARPATTEVFTGGDSVDGASVVLALDEGSVLVGYRDRRSHDRARFVVRRWSGGRFQEAAPPLVLPTDEHDAGALLAIDPRPLRLLVTTSISGPDLVPENPNTWQPRARVAALASNRWSVSEAFPASRAEDLGLATASGAFVDGAAWVALASGAGIAGHHVLVVGRNDEGQWTDLGSPLPP